MIKHTGLKDDYGTPINDGDSIEWTYYNHGVMIQNEDGTETFLGCVSGGEMIVKEFKEIKKIEYEIRGDNAGYFLDRPTGIATTFITEKPKCMVIEPCKHDGEKVVGWNAHQPSHCGICGEDL